MVKIITDSSCDIDLELCSKMDIQVIPIQVHFGETSFDPDINLTKTQFYEKLAVATELPTTTQISPLTFEEVFTEHIQNGDEVLGMFISRELSGTFQNAVIVSQQIDPEKIHIVDTLNTTFGLALLLEEATKLRDKGLGAKEIKSKIEDLVPRVCLYASIETLKYLKMGGRLSAGAAIVAGILGVCPIISVVNGKVEAIGKARGRVAANKFVLNQIESLGISSDYGITFGHSNSIELCKQTEKLFHEQIGKRKFLRCEIGAVIGTHIGSGACGIAFIKK